MKFNGFCYISEPVTLDDLEIRLYAIYAEIAEALFGWLP